VRGTLPDTVKTEVQAFADVNAAWLARMLVAACVPAVARALAIALSGSAPVLISPGLTGESGGRRRVFSSNDIRSAVTSVEVSIRTTSLQCDSNRLPGVAVA
jgi:hypothetical protein